MPIVFAAIAPHPPLLIPAIGHEHSAKLAKTAAAYDRLRQALFDSGAKTLVIISPHGTVAPVALSLNVGPAYEADFSDFGDLVTKQAFAPDRFLASRLQEESEGRVALAAISQPQLDYGTTIPALQLVGDNVNIKLLPLAYSGQNLAQHRLDGQALGQLLTAWPQRVALLASGDLSHRLTRTAPGGYWRGGKKFDQQVIELLSQHKIDELIGLDASLLEQAASCGLRSFALLAGMLDGLAVEPQALAYEAPFGIGYFSLLYRLGAGAGQSA